MSRKKLCEEGTLYNYDTEIQGEYDIVIGDDSKYIKITRSSFDNGIVALFIIAFIIIVLFIVYFIYEYFFPRSVQLRDLRNPSISPSFFNASAYTSEPACEANDRAEWNEIKGTCQCEKPYRGDMCQFDVLDNDYGIIKTSSNLLLDTLDTSIVSNLSISSNSIELSCTQFCDQDINCSSVSFEDDICNTIASITSTGREENMTFYIRKDRLNTIKYLDRVFIYNGELTLRVINTERSSGDDPHLRVFSDKVYRVHFYPQNILNSGELLGVYSVFPFEVDDFDRLVRLSSFNDSYIVDNGNLKLPIDWSDKNIWVMYKRV